MVLLLSRAQFWRRLVVALAVLLFAASASRAGHEARLAATGATAGLRPISRVDSPDNRVALTFDVTWEQDQLRQVLVVLDQRQVKATFFVGGTFLGLYGDAVRTVAKKGHEVGTLGQKMIDLAPLPEQEVASNLLASQSVLVKLLGQPVRYFRPPLGPASPTVMQGALAANLKTVTYSVDAEQYRGLKPEELARQVVKQTSSGDIIRLVASDWSKETARALPDIVSGLQAKGFRLVRISDLIVQDGMP